MFAAVFRQFPRNFPINDQRISKRFYRLRRALLYVPGDDERKIAKTRQLQVDSVILDCEDGVAENRKQPARETIANVLRNASSSRGVDLNPTVDYGVRVNSADSEYLADDLCIILGIVVPQTIYLPKVNTITDLDRFYEVLRAVTIKFSSTAGWQPPELIFYSESCRSIMDLPELCRHAIRLSERDKLPAFRLAGIIFGSDDLVADLGATRTLLAEEILYARQRVVLVAKAFGLQAIDMVDINLNNMKDLSEQCLQGSRMGFTGKQVIHPKQVDIVQKSFSPSRAAEEWARSLLKSYAEYQKEGKGAFVFHDQMIDAPTMKQARNIIDAIEKMKKK